MRQSFKGLACAAAALLALGAASSASAGAVPVSDQLLVLDGNGNFVDEVLALEPSETADQIYFIDPAVAPIDPSQFGNPTNLLEPDGSFSDIFGICTCGPGGALALGFNSDSETAPAAFAGVGTIFLPEHAGWYDATMYLDPALQAAGWTAKFASDVDVPEPATWALMLVGVGGLGAALRRRSAASAA
jgi:hypothetical protein